MAVASTIEALLHVDPNRSNIQGTVPSDPGVEIAIECLILAGADSKLPVVCFVPSISISVFFTILMADPG